MMIIDRKSKANQINSYYSTGPRSVAGKAQSSRNALRHGLTVSIRHGFAPSCEVERLASAIAGSNPSPIRFESAREIAEAELDLRSVRLAKLDLIEGAAFFQMKCAALAFKKYANLSSSENLSIAIMRVLPALLRLDRYERKSFTRRKKASRGFGVQ